MSIAQVKELVYSACDTLERDALGLAVRAAQVAHSERNVLRVGLNETSRQQVTQTLEELSKVFDDLESCGDRLKLVIQEFRAYADSL